MDVLISRLANLREMAADRGVPKVDLATIDDAIEALKHLRAAMNEALPFTMTLGQQILADALGPNVGDSLTTEAREIRLCWAFGGRTGGGLWRPDTPDNRRTLVSWVQGCNAQHGAGTHWLVERAA